MIDLNKRIAEIKETTSEERIASNVEKALKTATKLTEEQLIAMYTKKEANRIKASKRSDKKYAEKDGSTPHPR